MKTKTKTTEYTLKYTITSTDPRIIDDAHGVFGGLTPSKKGDRWLTRRVCTKSESMLEVIYETKSYFNVKFAKLALDMVYKTLKFKYGS